MQRIKVKLTLEEVNLLKEGIKSLNKEIKQLTFLDLNYLIGFTKLSVDKIYNYCMNNYTLLIEETELI